MTANKHAAQPAILSSAAVRAAREDTDQAVEEALHMLMDSSIAERAIGNIGACIERERTALDSPSACIHEVAAHNAKVNELIVDLELIAGLRKKETTLDLFCADCDAKPGEKCSGSGIGYHPARFFGKPDLLTTEQRATVDRLREWARGGTIGGPTEQLLAIIDQLAPVRR